MNFKKRMVCLLFSLVMLLSVVAFPVLTAQAVETEFATKEDIDPEKIIVTVTADKFRLPYGELGCDVVEEDPDSSVGVAAVFSYEKRAATGDKGLTKALTPPATLAFYCFSASRKDNRPIGEPTLAQLREVQNKDGYVVLKFEDMELIPEPGEYYAYLFDCWGLQIPFTNDQISAMSGKLVDVFLSMKIEGNIADPVADPPTYYIDQVIICEATPGDQTHEHSFGNWSSTDAGHSRVCESCGEKESGDHSWDAGVVTKQPSITAEGEKTYTCSECGGTKAEKLDRLEDIQDMGDADADKTPVKNQNKDNTVLILAICMGGAAVIVIVAAVLLLKKKK